MQNKALRVFTFLIQTAIFAVCLLLCVRGVLISQTTESISTLIWTLVKLLALFILSIVFFKTSISRSTPGDVFIALYILFGSVSFIKVFDLYSNLTGTCYIPPVVNVRLYMLSIIMMSLSLLGSGLYHQNNEHTAVSRFSAIIVCIALIMTEVLPAGQTYESLLSLPVLWLLYAVNGASIVIFFLLIATDPPGPDIVRHVSLILLTIGNHLSICFIGYYIQIVGNILFVIGCLMLMILTMRTYSRL